MNETRETPPPVMETISQAELRQLRYDLALARRDAAAWRALAEHGAPDLCAKVAAATRVAVEFAARGNQP